MASRTQHKKTAIITGGASGVGLAVATALSSRNDWRIYILDLDPSGDEVSQSLGSRTSFHRVDVTNYAALADVFELVFSEYGSIDFVFSNAGIVEKVDFYAHLSEDAPPPELDQLVLDVNLKSTINITYLAQHYNRKAESHDSARNVLITASVGSLYPCFAIPIYAASKHGILGLVRSVAPAFIKEGLRVNALCPGVMATKLMTDEDFKHYPPEYFTPIETLLDAVLKIVDGEDIEDARGRLVQGKDVHGKTIEINVRNIYFRDQPEWCDDAMPFVMAATDR
ncbi:15-hydroxyprostaglandin dehydrogenase [Penicillium robsamsonii]|uniref:15-hydroxyprostaglandin dehydrogenase n=1 Tax=Penicillium robsamsonii TaxID=1792511 RepID=UPI002546DF27|nr:15-hydroxyprostaglandin dehydrogenase [Penicillium robsamsonii]KAJ5817022.1 15-hydroxyprostaglandin dehydrogenase [Penicillium robsamsonii]